VVPDAPCVAPDSQTRLSGMGRCLILLSVLTVTFLGSVASSAQGQTETDSSKSEIALSRLFPPTYPRLAQQARITGAVEISLHIRPDGTVESADIISGHPMLKDSALESARQSQFECKECAQALTSYRLTYRFDIVPRDPAKTCAEPEQTPPSAMIDTFKHEVTVFAWGMWTCDPRVELIRVRSVKCLYLWKCDVRYPM
jgi:TonB family protein